MAVLADTVPASSSAPQHGTGAIGAKNHSDGGRDSFEPGFVPVQTRSGRFSSVRHSEFAAVSGHEAEWKLTPVSLVKGLLDGPLDGSRYEYDANAGAGASIEWIARHDRRVGVVGIPEERASANAWTNFDDALAITLRSEDHSIVTLDRSGLDATPRAAHTVILAEPNSSSTVILTSSGHGSVTENIEISVGDGASLTVIAVQEWAADALHLATHFATVGRAATLKHIVVSLGGRVVRVNPSVDLAGDGADAELYGLYFADAGQHLEHRVYLHHRAANTRGRVNYKGALQGAGARAVWVGDVLIGPDASGTDSYEQNRNLVLTEGARADSIPNLEIETGDILGAGHASATGRFDDEQLFYLQARGISETEAKRLVVVGFLAEIVQKVGDPALEARLDAAIAMELAITAPVGVER